MVGLGGAIRQNRAPLGRFLRLVGYRFGTYPDSPDSLWKGRSANFTLRGFSKVAMALVLGLRHLEDVTRWGGAAGA